MKPIISAIISILCCLAPYSHGASFDCYRASAEIEKAICDDANLSKLDDELANVYKRAAQDKSIRNTLLAQQRAWLKVVRNRQVDTYDLEEIYQDRIKQLTSKNPLVSSPAGTFQCEVNDDQGKYGMRSLRFRIQDGKLTEFAWKAISIPDSPDLRPGFHYRSETSLDDTILIKEPGFWSLQEKPEVRLPQLPHELPENCDIILTKHESRLRVYTLGCWRRPDTSYFNYTFSQSGSTCRLESESR